MDSRWLLLSLAAAAVTALRLRHRATTTGPTDATKDQVAADQDPGPAAPEPPATPRNGDRAGPARPRDPGSAADESAVHGEHEPLDPLDARGAVDATPDRTLDGPIDGPFDGSFDGPFDGAIDGTLDDALDRVWAEHARGAETLMEARLRQLVLRRVPVRAIRRAPGRQAVRVVFADGTVLLCRGTGQGDFGRLGVALHRGSVHIESYAHVADSTRLEFTWWQGQRLAATAVGLDQPD